MTEQLDQNRIFLSGTVDGPPSFSHEHHGESFYQFTLATPRLSGQIDRLPITVPGRLLVNPLREGMLISFQGQLRSYNRYFNSAHRLVLSVYMLKLDNEQYGAEHSNEIQLCGTLCKQPVYRRTPLGREIADILLAVNRSPQKADYIPCIAWSKDAKMLEQKNTGDRLRLLGRMQSREYQKQLPDGLVETRVAYEVSVTQLEI